MTTMTDPLLQYRDRFPIPSARNTGVRFSPHFYTTDEEIDAAFEVVDDILRTGRWQKQAARQTIVT